MPFQLRKSLYYAACQDDIILLDLRANRYFALPRHLHSAFLGVIEGGGDDSDALGNLSSLLAPKCLPADHPSPRNVSLDVGKPSVRLASGQQSPAVLDLARALHFRAKASFLLRFASLEQIVGKIGYRKAMLPAPIGAPGVDQAMLMASAYRTITPLFPVRNRCIPVSIGLMLALLGNGVPAVMIIGVRTSPFAAHCWVQMSDWVINDEPDFVGRFTPILAI